MAVDVTVQCRGTRVYHLPSSMGTHDCLNCYQLILSTNCTFIFGAIRIDKGALAMFLILHPFTNVPSTILESESIYLISWQQTPWKLFGFYRTEDRFWPDFADITLSNMVIHRSFTVPTHRLLANIQGLVSFAVPVKPSLVLSCTKP